MTTEPLLGVRGEASNVPFEQRVSEVTACFADYGLLHKSRRRHLHQYMACAQTIMMYMQIRTEGDALQGCLFPHVTCNVLAYQNLP